MYRQLVLALASVAPVGCTPMTPPSPSPPPTGAEVYSAIGTEPGWTLTIGADRMVYDGDYGKTRISVPTPEPRTTFNGHRYVTPRLTVDITHIGCNDGMSDRRYPDTVRVIADGKGVRGCGGDPVESANLDGSNWAIVGVDGDKPSGPRQATMQFAKGRISGSTGCNSYGGSYQVAGDTLTVGQVISTKMACVGGGMQTEGALFDALAHPLHIMLKPGGRMLLTGDGGASIVLERAGGGSDS